MTTRTGGRGADRSGDRPAPRRRPRRPPPAPGQPPRRPVGEVRPSARIRRRRQVFWLTVLVVLFLGVFGYVFYFSPVLGVRSVRVEGAKTVSAKEIADAAQVPLGDPLLRVDTTGIADRVSRIPRVASAEVVRSWPSTMLISVTERTPVVMLRAPDGIKLVDSTGFAYATVPVPPSGLPELVVGTVSPGDPATTAALHVFLGLPDKLRAEVLGITAPSPADVNLTLSQGRQVRWGADDQDDRKVAVLQALIGRPGKVYNVQAPDAPAIS